MLTPITYGLLLLLAAFFQELLDRYVLKSKKLERVAILSCILVGVLCLSVLNTDLGLRSSNNIIFVLFSISGICWFGIFRHWYFGYRVKRA